jgi:hypothetical protein
LICPVSVLGRGYPEVMICIVAVMRCRCEVMGMSPHRAPR